jgi:REP element-mobilizing transposase RayT
MPRALRFQAANASYHVFNRGNYRAPIFATDGAKRAFLQCLDETCSKTRWLVHAWCLMSNHYHLAITTPEPNLAVGVHWLQTTFATRFNRYRKEHGHVFQDRYKSPVVEPGDALGRVCHYIHLNPVRAHLCSPRALARYPWTSLSTWDPPEDPAMRVHPLPALQHAGSLTDTPKGRRRYLDYLCWLAEDEPAQKAQQFDHMCRGWAIGTEQFARRILAGSEELQASVVPSGADMRAAHEAHWKSHLDQLLRRVGHRHADLRTTGKSVEWKVAVAAALKCQTTADNPWLSRNLHLGSRHEIGRKVAAWLRDPSPTLLRQVGLNHTPHNPAP